ncbi:MAG: HAD-IA family hydrolase [Deltaproteobacteria bacterium]|nr:HAD-IA family hydrolase [Deltaproteobacteria bacterium]
MIHTAYRINAVLFDFDGTLSKPGTLDFPRLKKEIGCPPDDPVLEFIEGLPTRFERETFLSMLEQFEMEAAVHSEPNPGAEDLIAYLRSKGIGVGLITRNRLSCIERALENFNALDISDFDVVVSRETPVDIKPSGAGVLLAARTLNVDVQQVLMVGDYIFDIQAGQAAGCMTALLGDGTASGSLKIHSDFRASDLDEIKDIIRLGLPLSMGKLPNDLLEKFLDRFNFHDPSVLIHAGVGEDTTAVDIDGDEVLVIKSDPITFATDHVGHYAVLVNANDIATSGATPRWLLTTLLFPAGVVPSAVGKVMHELESVSRQWNISLCGGHTEITDAVTRPVIIGMLAGTVAKGDLVDKRNIQPGDSVLLTKAVAVEGTAIIAREFGDRLAALGMSKTEIEACRQFLSSIGILEEADIAGSFPGVSGMHDITEGGLATALLELSIAGGHRIRVAMERIPVFPETRKICRLLHIDPMGLIGSGSFLICCRGNIAEPLMKGIRDAGIHVTRIGEVTDPGRGIDAVGPEGPVPWPSFEVDEITRLF